jgi:hypothetical protein
MIVRDLACRIGDDGDVRGKVLVCIWEVSAGASPSQEHTTVSRTVN